MIRTLALPAGRHEFLVGLSSRTELYYGNVTLDVANSDMEQPVRVGRGVRVSGTLTVEGDNGRREVPPGLYCKLRSEAPSWQTAFATSSTGGCIGAEYTPGHYHLEIDGLPRDAYVASARIGDKDVLVGGVELKNDVELHIIVSAAGATIDGVVRDSKGQKLSDATVALVPDEPLRSAGHLYRSSITDINGRYELRGVAPGAYRIFAWTELEGAAFRNAEFMKKYDETGHPIKIQNSNRSSTDLVALD